MGLLLQGRLSLRFSGSPSRCSAPSLVISSSLPAVTSAKTDDSLIVTSSPDLSLNAHTHTREQASPFHWQPSRTRWSRVSSGPPRGSPARSSLAPPALHLDQLEKLLVTQPGKNPGAALDIAFPLAHLPANPFGSKLNTSPTAYCSPLPPSPLTWKTLRASRLETQHPGGPRHRASQSSHAAAHSPGLPGPSGSGQALRWPRPLARLHLLQAPRTHRTTPLRLCRAPEAQLNAWPALPSVSSPLRWGLLRQLLSTGRPPHPHSRPPPFRSLSSCNTGCIYATQHLGTPNLLLLPSRVWAPGSRDFACSITVAPVPETVPGIQQALSTNLPAEIINI